MKLITALALCALTAPAALALPVDDTTHVWYGDFDEAAKIAKEQHKDLFVDFTGSDWCGWCIKLHDEVFQYDSFLTAAQKDYVLVALDYPRSDEVKAKVPNPARNEELREKYNIRGYPTILMMTAEGEVFAQSGYREGGPEAYVEHMAQVRTEGRKALVEVKQVSKAFTDADEAGKPAAWEAVMKVLEGLSADSPFVAQLTDAARWAFTADADNAKGMKLRALKALLKAGQVDEELMQAGRELDPKNEQGVLEQVVDAQFMNVDGPEAAEAARDALNALNLLGYKDKEIGFMLNFTMCRWCAGPLEDPEGVQKFGEKAKAIGTDNQQMLDYLDNIMNG
ncbi:MAG: thioredoxin family protein [Planctomycetes bacterium]|nr:thioredoxin family protein [Planctomycetota bacterium]